ncbi:MAG: hypothetical protein K2X81_21060 [Candidatus Obscuribacterales bacterium]|nr:hypothetical protein [Candidatus Obscuribacterales bacterium]
MAIDSIQEKNASSEKNTAIDKGSETASKKVVNEISDSRGDVRNITAANYAKVQNVVDEMFGTPKITDDSAANSQNKKAAATNEKPTEADWNKAEKPNLKLDNNTWKAVTQGPVTPDCPLISEIIKTTHDNPEKIKDMIRVEKGSNSPKDDTYLVKLPGAKSPDEIIRVTHDDLKGCNGAQLKTDAAGNSDPARNKEPGLSGAWPSVIEAAVGKHWFNHNVSKENQQSLKDSSATNKDASLAAMSISTMFGAGSAATNETMRLMTGKNSETKATHFYMTPEEAQNAASNYSTPTQIAMYLTYGRSASELSSEIRDAATKGEHVILGRDGHAYSLISMDDKGQNSSDPVLLIRNPYNNRDLNSDHDKPATNKEYNDGAEDGVIKIRLSQVGQYFQSYGKAQK